MNDEVIYPIKITENDLDELKKIVEISKKLNVDIDLDMLFTVAIKTFIDIIKNEGLKSTFKSYFEKRGVRNYEL